VEASTAVATALLPAVGYDRASEVAKRAQDEGMTIREVVLDEGLVTADEFEQLITPEAVTRLGSV
jgi:fumarate hydratase class II